MSHLTTAFKEWAVICEALARGRQSLILRKGGIAESGGEFRVEHERFWLFPTWTHQQEAGIRPEAKELLSAVLCEEPPQGLLRIAHYVEVKAIYEIRDLEKALSLAPMHVWSDATVEQRFHYRGPGLFALAVRTWTMPQPHLLANIHLYDGCKSWVQLADGLDTTGSTPVIGDAEFETILENLHLLAGERDMA